MKKKTTETQQLKNIRLNKNQGQFDMENLTVNFSDKPTGVSIPATSTLELDPLNWVLFTLKKH